MISRCSSIEYMGSVFTGVEVTTIFSYRNILGKAFYKWKCLPTLGSDFRKLFCRNEAPHILAMISMCFRKISGWGWGGYSTKFG